MGIKRSYVYKIRSDKGKKRKFYAGKRVKKRPKHSDKFVAYKSNRNRDDPVGVQFVEVCRMTMDGYRNWNKKLRPHIRTKVYKAMESILVPPEDLSTPEKIGEVAIDFIQYPGTFQMRMSTHRTNEYRVSYVTKCVVILKESSGELVAKVIDTHKGINRYWFYRGSERQDIIIDDS